MNDDASTSAARSVALRAPGRDQRLASVTGPDEGHPAEARIAPVEGVGVSISATIATQSGASLWAAATPGTNRPSIELTSSMASASPRGVLEVESGGVIGWVSGSKASSRSYMKDERDQPTASVDIRDAAATSSWHAVTLSVAFRPNDYL